MKIAITHHALVDGGTRIVVELDTDISDPGTLQRLFTRLSQVNYRALIDFESGDAIGRALSLNPDREKP